MTAGVYTKSLGENSSAVGLVEATSTVQVKPVLRPITLAQHVLNKSKYHTQLDKPSSLFLHEKKMLKAALGPEIHNPDDKNKRVIYLHCLNLMNNALKQINEEDNFKVPYHHAQETIAKIVFLAHRDAAKTQEIVQSKDPAKKVNKAISSQVAAIKQHLDQIVAAHKKVGLQSIDNAYFVAFHLEIFKALMLPDGRLNVGLIPTLLKELFDEQSLDTDWKKQTKAILEKIQSSKEIQLKAAGIKKPEANNTLANTLIRLTLDIPPEKDITDLDARIVATSGMIPVRQGPVGNCFVICNAIWFVTTVLDKTFTDFSQILQYGELIRMQGEQKLEYPIDFDISDPDLDTSFQINEFGKLKSGAYLWESPGILSACVQLGLKEPQAVLKNFIQKFSDSKGKGGGFEMTPRDFFGLLAKLSPINSSQDSLANQACLAFSSKTNMPLIHAWTSALAAMDQSQQSSSLHDKINNCWTATFADTWKQLHQEMSPSLASKIQGVFNEHIFGRMVIEYDESVQTPLAADGSSTAGSFVYFEQDLDASATTAKPLHTYKDLTQYALNSLNVVDKKLDTDVFLTPGACQKAITKIRAFINQGDKFADIVLSNYDDTLKAPAPLTEKWSKFQDFGKIGGDNVHVFQLAMGFPLPTSVQAGQATAKERLATIIQFLRDQETKDHFIETPAEERYEMDSDDHAFTLPTDNPTILPYVKSNEDINKMIESRIFQPCQVVTEAIITEEQKTALIKESLRLAPKELGQKYIDMAKGLNGKTLHEYTQAMFKVLVKFNPGMDKATKSTLLAKFTNIVLYQALTNSQFKIIREATVLGPDTNWVDDDEQRQQLLDIFFAFTLNPVTNNIEFFEIDENSSGLYALSQDDWIGGPWNMYGLNLAKAAEDSQKTS